MLVRDLRDRFDVEHIAAGIADGLAIEAPGFRCDGLAEVFGIVGLYELDVVAELAEADIELRVGAAIERAGGNQLVTRLEQAADGEELSRLAARGREPGDAVLE